MLGVAKIHRVALLGTLLLWASARSAYSADAPLAKALLGPSEQSEVVPRRAPRPMSRSEIFHAIQADLLQKGFSGGRALRPADLRIQSSVPSLAPDMGLEVKTIRYDPLRRLAVFEMWASHAPQYLPFKVTARIDPESLGLASPAAGMAEDADRSARLVHGKEVAGQVPKPVVLARPGTPATLVLLGQDIRVTTTVEPLQPGTKGQCILVRDLTTARVMSAQVVDKGLLQASF